LHSSAKLIAFVLITIHLLFKFFARRCLTPIASSVARQRVETRARSYERFPLSRFRGGTRSGTSKCPAGGVAISFDLRTKRARYALLSPRAGNGEWRERNKDGGGVKGRGKDMFGNSRAISISRGGTRVIAPAGRSHAAFARQVTAARNARRARRARSGGRR